MKRLSPWILFFIVSGCVTLPNHFVDLQNQSRASFDEVLKEIDYYPVIFIGEVHSSERSHLLQLEVIKYLHEQGKKVVIAFEMFSHGNQGVLDRWVRGDLQKREFMMLYKRYIKLPYGYYGPMLDYARQERIPVRGINADQTLIRNVSKSGIKSAPKDMLEELKYIDCSEDTEYADALGFSAGKKFHKMAMPFLCDGQRLRDSIMAYNIAQIAQDKDVTIVVILGVVHAVKAAVPRILHSYSSTPFIVLVPEFVKSIVTQKPGDEVADYMWY